MRAEVEHKVFVNIGGRTREIPPVSIGDSIKSTNIGTDNQILPHTGDAVEIPFKSEYTEEFFEQMKKELSVVDITNWPAWLIERLLEANPDISKLVTRNAAHYRCMQMEKGFACVAGDYDTLFGVPLILDRKGRIKAAQVEIRTEGGDKDDERKHGESI